MKTSRFTILLVVMALAWPLVAKTQGPRAEERLQAAINKETVDGDLKTAIELYRQLEDSPNHAVAAKALLRMGECYEKLGDSESRKAYEQVVARFPDQVGAVAEARRHLAANKPTERPETGLVERQLITFSDSEDLPDVGGVSADGRYVALVYFTRNDGNRIVLRDLVSGEERTVANRTDCYFALLSADGKQVLCSSDDGHGRRELRILRTDGSSRTLTSRVESYGLGDWSSDGRFILARVSRQSPERAAAPYDMVVVSVSDGSERVLKSGGGVGAGASSPRFSPDGRYIVFPATRIGADGKPLPDNNGRGSLHVMCADGSGEVPLVSGTGTELDWSPLWSPDGAHIVFHSDRSGTRALWAQRVVDGKPVGEPKRLEARAGDDWVIGFARDGTLYCLRYFGGGDIYVAEVDPDTGKVVGPPRRANQTFVGASVGPVSWSADGKQLAFDRLANSKRTLVIHSVDTGAERELTGAPPRVTAWFPDGRTLLAERLRVDAATGHAEPISGLPPFNSGPFGNGVALSHDGTTIYYSVKDGQEVHGGFHVRLMRRRIDSGEEKTIYETTSPLDFLHSIAVSPDDRQVAFGELVDQVAVLKVVSSEGGTARELLTKFAWSAAWATDARHVFARAVMSDGKVQLVVVPASGGELRPTGLKMNVQFVVHPDGRHIAYQSGAADGDPAAIVAIKNLLRVK